MIHFLQKKKSGQSFFFVNFESQIQFELITTNAIDDTVWLLFTSADEVSSFTQFSTWFTNKLWQDNEMYNGVRRSSGVGKATNTGAWRKTKKKSFSSWFPISQRQQSCWCSHPLRFCAAAALETFSGRKKKKLFASKSKTQSSLIFRRTFFNLYVEDKQLQLLEFALFWFAFAFAILSDI